MNIEDLKINKIYDIVKFCISKSDIIYIRKALNE